MASRSQKVRLAFTLIELLFVMSVIALLAVFILASVKVARIKARDAVRLSDINQIKNALNLYFDKYSYYPRSGITGGTMCMTGYTTAPSIDPSWCNSVSGGNQWIRNTRTDGGAADLSEYFKSGMPKDPANNATQYDGAQEYAYWYYSSSEANGSNNQGYVLHFKLEDKVKEQEISISIKNTNCTLNNWSANNGAVAGVTPPVCF